MVLGVVVDGGYLTLVGLEGFVGVVSGFVVETDVALVVTEDYHPAGGEVL